MSCYAYEILGTPFLTDAEFDELGQFLHDWWDVIDHPHKKFIDPEGCAFTSALTVRYNELPLIVLNATHTLLKTCFKGSNIFNSAMENLEMRELL